jgi:chromosome segregation ATPase
VFDLEYLLTGKGSLLTIEEEVKNEDIEKMTNPHPIDQSSLVNAAIAAKDETIDSLKSRIADLQRTISDKEEIIKAREARIVALERQLASASMSDIERYPFTIGAAEDINEPKTP